MRFELCGVQVRVGFLFAFLLCCLLTVVEDRFVRMTVAFSLLHECGHLACDYAFGCKPRAVRFGLFGMTIVRKEDTRLSYRQEICSALAGPAVNLLLFWLLLAGYILLRRDGLLTAAAVNSCIFAFNATPVFSLDGGRALEAFLRARLEDMRRCAAIEKAVSLAFITLLMGFGFFVLLRSGGNFTLLLLCGYLVAVLFLKCGE